MRIRTRHAPIGTKLCTLRDVTEHGFLCPPRRDRNPDVCHVYKGTGCPLLGVTLTAIQVKRMTCVILS